MTEMRLTLPLTDADVSSLAVGDVVYLSGTVYSARDAAHKRMYDAVTRGGALPFDVNGAAVYYMGPSPAREGRVIGSAGPTTSTRMDAYTPALLERGLRVMIGKGKRSAAVKDAMVKSGAVYFAAVGGAGALLSSAIVSSEVIAYADLGTEAVRCLEVKDFPCVVAIDAAGHDVYER